MRAVLILVVLHSCTVNAVIKVACIGGSGTLQYKDGKAGAADAYPEVLGNKLGSGFEVRNMAAVASSVRNEVHCKANPYRKSQKWKDTLEWKPDIVTIMLGMNDAKYCNWKEGSDGRSPKQMFVDGVNDMLDTLWENSKPKIYLLNLVPQYPPYPHKEQFMPEVINEQLPAIFREIAEAKLGGPGHGLVDTFGLMGGKELKRPDIMLKDGAHFGVDGHKEVGNLLYDRIVSDGYAHSASAAAQLLPVLEAQPDQPDSAVSAPSDAADKHAAEEHVPAEAGQVPSAEQPPATSEQATSVQLDTPGAVADQSTVTRHEGMAALQPSLP
jgi:lysophospholipase L1-like esterase